MPHPIANGYPDGQNRKSGELSPSMGLWKISDSVIPPFLIPFVMIFWLMPKRENDPFHTFMLLNVRTIVVRQGGPSASDMEQERSPALACTTLVSRAFH